MLARHVKGRCKFGKLRRCRGTEDILLTVSMTTARARLEELVDLASRGEIVTVTRYGKPVATIISMKQGAEIYPELRREPAAAVEG